MLTREPSFTIWLCMLKVPLAFFLMAGLNYIFSTVATIEFTSGLLILPIQSPTGYSVMIL